MNTANINRYKTSDENEGLFVTRTFLSKVATKGLPLHLLFNAKPRHSTSAITDISEQDESLDSGQQKSCVAENQIRRLSCSDRQVMPNDLQLHDSSPSHLRHSRSSVESRAGTYVNNDYCLVKKKNPWNCKWLQNLPRIMQDKFHCVFSLQIHRIDGLPETMNGLSVFVCLRRKDHEKKTRPSLVVNGTAELEQVIHERCTLWGSKNAKQQLCYSSKICTLVVLASGNKESTLGKYHIDLSKLLREFSEFDTEEEKRDDFTTKFHLRSHGKGGTLTISFSFKFLKKELLQMQQKNRSYADSYAQTSKQTFGGHSYSTFKVPAVCGTVGDADRVVVKTILNGNDKNKVHADAPDNTISDRASVHHQMKRNSLSSLFADMVESSSLSNQDHRIESSIVSNELNCESPGRADNTDDAIGFKVVEKRVEFCCEPIPVAELLEPNEISPVINPSSSEIEYGIQERIQNPSIQQLGTHAAPKANVDIQLSTSSQFLSYHEPHINGAEGKTSPKTEEDLIVTEFLSNLKEDTDPSRSLDSSQEFHNKTDLNEDNLISSPDELRSPNAYQDASDCDKDSKLASLVEKAELEFQKLKQITRSKVRAKLLEDAETLAVMQKWGIDEQDLKAPVPETIVGSGNPPLVRKTPKQHLLFEQLNSAVDIENGGIVKPVRLSLLVGNDCKGRLTMQLSKPLIIHRDNCSDTTYFLQNLASLGVERLTKQATLMMPLVDIINSRTVEQIAKKVESQVDFPEYSSPCRQQLIYPDRSAHHKGEQKRIRESAIASQETKHLRIKNPRDKKQQKTDILKEFVSLPGIIPAAIDELEVLVLEGLKIQSNMVADYDFSSASALQSREMASFSDMEISQIGTQDLDSTCPFPKGNGGRKSVDDLKTMAIPFDEWMQLHSEKANKEANANATSHHPVQTQAISNFNFGKAFNHHKINVDQNCTMGKGLTIAMRVQLHDPLDNYEAVGAPMIALIGAENVLSASPSITERNTLNVSKSKHSEEPKGAEEELSFRVTSVHIADLDLPKNHETNNRSTTKQMRSGSRWLIANGMGKNQKSSFASVKHRPSKISAGAGNSLWSISAPVHGYGNRWKGNPNTSFPTHAFAL